MNNQALKTWQQPDKIQKAKNFLHKEEIKKGKA